jgi:hypothetical protein
MITVIIAIFCLILGAGLVYLFMQPKVKVTQKENKEILEKNKAVQFELQAMEQRTDYLKEQYEQKLQEYKQLKQDVDKEYKASEESVKKYYQQMLDFYKQKFHTDTEEIHAIFMDTKHSLEDSYEELAKDLVQDYLDKKQESVQKIKKLNEKIQFEESQLEDLRHKVEAAVAYDKRNEENKNKTDFYKLNLTQDDLDEIYELRKIISHFRNPEPVNKVIWKTYYEKPYTDLVGRVIGSGVHCGIYKITNLQNNMCYVGQSTNIAERWKQHIKRGLGADTPTRNKLYPIMQAVGVENFSFEIIEECTKSQLNDREDYWQDFFKAKEFGYSIK